MEISVLRRIVRTTLQLLDPTSLATIELDVVQKFRNTVYDREILNVGPFKATGFEPLFNLDVTIFWALHETMCT